MPVNRNDTDITNEFSTDTTQAASDCVQHLEITFENGVSLKEHMLFFWEGEEGCRIDFHLDLKYHLMNQLRMIDLP
jgi:hypothetical protein